MIATLTGTLTHKAPSAVTLDVHGVGYEVFIPLSTFYALPEANNSVSLKIYTYLRDDALQLYGFLTTLEKEAFILLTGVSGIGPKLALNVLSALTVPDLVAAIRTGDAATLASVPGIGKKTAARLALELKDKVDRLPMVPASVHTARIGRSDPLQDDALSALVNLGYKVAEVKDAITQVLLAQTNTVTLTDLIRGALQILARRAK
jgi:Holliday junction DNA helicase RuvA